MKPPLLLFCVLFLTYSTIAQDHFSHHNEITPAINGQLTGYDPEEDAGLTLKFVCVIPTPERQKEYLVAPGEDGRFEFTMEYPLRYQQIWFRIGEYYYGQLLVDKGLTITADLASLKQKSERFEAAQLPLEKADMVRLVGGREDIWERAPYIEKVLPAIKNPWCADIMRQEWAIIKERILKANERLKAIRVSESSSPIGETIGTLPGGAELFLADQEEVDSLLGAIRSAFPGKAVLLDVWATWCGPCIYDMEESATNIGALRKMGVEVVYMCTANGTTQDGWQKKVAELNLNTKHIYLNPELSKSIMSYFDLKGYPSHVFLDKEGKYHPDLVHSIRHIDFEAVRERL